MKNNKIIIAIIITMVIMIILLFFLMFTIMTGRISLRKMGNYKVSSKLVIDKTYSNNYEEILINSDAADINIKESGDNNFRVVIYGNNKEKVKVEESNQTLNINYQQDKTCHFFCINLTIFKIDVYIPNNYMGKINVNNRYGDIDIASFKDANMSVDSQAGDVEIGEGNVIDIKNNYGDTEVDKAREIKIVEDAGDVKVGEVSIVNIENNYGDIEVDKIWHSLDIEADCGDIDIKELNIMKDSRIENNLGDITVGTTNEIYIDAKTSLGDTKVNNNYRYGEYTLTINNDCGDIKVNN